MNMYQLLERTAQTWPDNVFLVREGVNYKDFIDLVKARAASLDKAGVKKGDVVGILSHNIPNHVVRTVVSGGDGIVVGYKSDTV